MRKILASAALLGTLAVIGLGGTTTAAEAGRASLNGRASAPVALGRA